jgi:hypothetical protein
MLRLPCEAPHLAVCLLPLHPGLGWSLPAEKAHGRHAVKKGVDHPGAPAAAVTRHKTGLAAVRPTCSCDARCWCCRSCASAACTPSREVSLGGGCVEAAGTASARAGAPHPPAAVLGAETLLSSGGGGGAMLRPGSSCRSRRRSCASSARASRCAGAADAPEAARLDARTGCA